TAVNDFMDSVHHIWCPLSSQEFQDLPDGAETTLTKEPQLKMAQQLSLDFYRMLKTKNKSQLNQWFSDVSQSGLIDLQRVAAGMEADATAIHEAISSRWSNGVVEGHVNRLKMLKRQMYGRAGFELLRRRVMSPLA
ncbi:transposase, partial [Klebsiella pneumoniae]|uniref:transposase n=1 Tax=Klebsiella pneumoniae TaxID=573 RepID=UPI001D0F22BE